MDLSRQIDGLSVIHTIYAHTRLPGILEVLQNQYGSRAIEDWAKIEGLTVSVGAVISRVPGICRIFVAGIEPGAMGRRMAVGYSNTLAVNLARGFHPYAAENAAAIWAHDIRNRLRPEDRLELHGHSSGGCICEVIAKIAQREFPRMMIDLDTYGSPSPSIRGATASGPTLIRQRWMLDGDPAPWVPHAILPTGNALLVWAFGGGFTMVPELQPHPERFQQPAGGLRLTVRRVSGFYVTYIGPDPAATIQAWIDGESEQLDAHDADTYRLVMRRHSELFAATPAITTNNVVMPLAATPTVNVVLPFPLPGTVEAGVVMPIEIRPNGITLDRAGTIVGSTTLGGSPMSFLKINPRHGFRRVKVGNVWKVTLDGQIILTADEKTVPGSIVKRGNAFLRALGTRNTVFITDLSDAFTQWMIAATSNDDFARPLLRGVP